MDDAALAAWSKPVFTTVNALVPLVDVLAPEFYTRWRDFNVWAKYIGRGVKAIQRRWPGKRIQPVLYGTLYDTYDTPDGSLVLFPGEFISADYMLQQITEAYRIGCSGATVFCELNWDRKSIPWWNDLVAIFH
jgi:hypothetical protein